ncbi:hypothetical protein H5410_028223, partial [Solanum commersonii]
ILSYLIKWVLKVFKNLCCEEPLGVVGQDRRCIRRSTLWSVLSPFSIFTLSTLEHWARLRPFTDLPNTLGNPQAFFYVFSAVLFIFVNSAVQNGCLKQCYTRFNHECTHKTKLTYARINCVLKDSSCDTPLSKNLKLTIFASSASSSSTKEIKCPHTNNDSMFTHNGLII